jgi:eukaryotic-like serine/threonine-protein kinase
MTTETPDRWRRVSQLFDAAMELPAERRATFLDDACGDDADLRRRLADLLEASGKAAGFLERPIIPAGPPAARAEPPPQEPSSATTATATGGGEAREVIGPYRLLRKIGEGGMGEVWLAEQGEPIRREVALKVIKAGMDTRQVIARFEAERQALALMDHPCIAKVYDAGETPRHLPYFAMEYVPGEAITTYCDRHRLSMQDRLRLFTQVCDGVQHAHQKGVIHRDLKPSNVLVTIVGDRPVVKIIDFGVAKATAQRLTEKTLFTELGVLIGTPEYMSPEQAEMTGLDVDTRTDVYALGVMLYELLTGALPFDSRELRQAGFEEIRRLIREVDPPRPSTRVRSLGERSTEAATRRGTEPRRLISRLRGDLDWIVMKALEKDRTRRYGSPADMAGDVERHLNHQPVVAGPPGASYRAGKFVRRHRFGVAVAAVTVLALVGFGVAMAAQAHRIGIERNRAEKVSEFLTNLFKVSDPGQARGESITAREILDKGAAGIEKELGDEPEVQAQLLLTMSEVYLNLGLYGRAEPLCTKSVEIRRRVLGDQHPDTLTALETLSKLYERQGRYAESEKLSRSNLEARRRILGKDHRLTLFSKERLAVAIERQGRYEEALQLQMEVLEARRRVLPPDDQQTIWSMQDVAADYQWLGQYEKAESLYREAYELRKSSLGADHPDTLWILNNLGRVAFDRGNYAGSERLLREAWESRRRVLGPDHSDTLDSLGNLANTCASLGRFDEAERLGREAYERCRRVFGEEGRRTLFAKDSLAGYLHNLGRSDEAAKTYREVIETKSRVFGPEDRSTMASKNNLATALLEAKRYDEAEAIFRQVLDVFRRDLGPNRINTQYALMNLGEAIALRGRFDEAEGLFKEAVDGLTRIVGANSPDTWTAQLDLAGLAALRGRRAEALASIRRIVEAGFRDPSGAMAKDPILEPLRGDPEFGRLVAAASAAPGAAPGAAPPGSKP